MLSGDNVLKVKYFTAPVQELGDPRRPVRQQIYWRALKELYGEKIEIIKGSFRVDPKRFSIARIQEYSRNSPATDQFIWTIKTEEKGSDVNLAVHLVNDAWKNLYDVALVISNDSDLAESLRIARHECRKEIILANPFLWGRNNTAIDLQKLNLSKRVIRENQLRQCQLPEKIPGTNIYKPPEW